MPRIVPIQLLRCLKVLLNPNGGILSLSEVKRISCLMTKYSKKLVSKCIYVQILKCTNTELLDEFMRVGGWNLVFTWLNDGIRLSNWPLVQEIVELLLLCPVDVNRLKTNSAPKTVKGLSNNGGTEAVRILADRLVKQWLKVVTEGNEQAVQARPTTDATLASAATTPVTSAKHTPTDSLISEATTVILKPEKVNKNDPEIDPLYVPETVNATENLRPTTAQKKGMKSGLVYKIVVKDGQQLLTKVDTAKNEVTMDDDSVDTNDDDDVEMIDNDDTSNAVVEEDEDEDNAAAAAADIVEEDSTSFDKAEDKDSSESSVDNLKKSKERKTSVSSDTKVKLDNKHDQQEHKNKDSKSSKEHKSEKDKERKSSSSSSSHRSSSSHKSSSKSSSSSSSSKSKSSSSSSSSHRSSSDKHRSDKERNSSSSKDKDRSTSSSSSSSSKHKSSSKSSSSSSSSKERHREKDKEKMSSSSQSSKKDREREKEVQAEKDKDTLAKMLPPSLDKLGKIPKKPRDDKEDSTSSNSNVNSNKPTSITIPSKKASISIEIRRDAEKTSAVKTYKSQFRSHGLTEEAPPPPSRKTLKKPNSTHSGALQTGAVIPTSLPSSLKRASPPPKEPIEKKQKIDINSISPAAASAAEKPGAIKLIPPKRIQTLVETNLFSDALSAATGPKKVTKRKRPATSGSEPTTPTSPDAAKVAPLKFYQDTLDESAKAAGDDKGAANAGDKTKTANDIASNGDADENATDKDGNENNSLDDDDDIPLKKVKEDIEQRVRNQKKADGDGAVTINEKSIELLSENEDADGRMADGSLSPEIDVVRKPGPGCGPDGPPGVLMLHRRRGPKKKLTWRPQETLEQIRYFEMDENERVNVMKVSFLDMKNMERFNERASLTNLSRRGPRPGDNQEPRTEWRPLIEVDDVPVHPDGAQSRERKVQADREMTTLRALYFSPNMIPDSPSEAELEPHSTIDPPTIPLDDITGNPDAVNDFSGMPWPEPKGQARNNDNCGTGGLGSLGNAADMFGALNAATVPPKPREPMPTNPFNNFMHPYGGNAPGPVNNMMSGGPPPPPQMQMPPNGWQGPPPMQGNNMMGNPFQGPPNPDMMMGGGPRLNFMPQPGPGFNGPPPPFMGAGSPQYGPPGFGPNGPNFGPMGPGGPPMMNNMGPGPGPMNGPRGGGGNNGPNNRNNSNWIHGPHKNFRDNNDSWRPAGSGNNNNGVCKAYMRGNCSVKNCKYIHPKSRR